MGVSSIALCESSAASTLEDCHKLKERSKLKVGEVKLSNFSVIINCRNNVLLIPYNCSSFEPLTSFP